VIIYLDCDGSEQNATICLHWFLSRCQSTLWYPLYSRDRSEHVLHQMRVNVCCYIGHLFPVIHKTFTGGWRDRSGHIAIRSTMTALNYCLPDMKTAGIRTPGYGHNFRIICTSRCIKMIIWPV